MKAVSRAIKAALFAREGLKICAKELKGKAYRPLRLMRPGRTGVSTRLPLDDHGRTIK